MDMQELKAAAERRHKLQEIPLDHAIICDFAVSLLSDAPVTAEWLRETWGADIYANGRVSSIRYVPPKYPQAVMRLRVEFAGNESYVIIECDEDGEAVGVACSPTTGQFTMLALGLGLTPKK